MWRSQVNLAGFGNQSMLLKAGARSNRVIPTKINHNNLISCDDEDKVWYKGVVEMVQFRLTQ